MDERERTAALSQTIFRAGNEALLTNADPELHEIPFLCECADEHCLETLRLARADYERVRAHPRRFVVLPGHETAGVEPPEVVEESDRFVVLEQAGDAGRIAEQHDPRSRAKGRA